MSSLKNFFKTVVIIVLCGVSSAEFVAFIFNEFGTVSTDLPIELRHQYVVSYSIYRKGNVVRATAVSNAFWFCGAVKSNVFIRHGMLESETNIREAMFKNSEFKESFSVESKDDIVVLVDNVVEIPAEPMFCWNIFS